MVLEDRFIFVVVHYERDIATPQYNQQKYIDALKIEFLDWYKRKAFKRMGLVTPFSTKG
jgi:hypothetical protein